jgi:aspartyl-tRNA(Asn)/glutamyl-tRNA(Gln) amidotransferase subunit B
MEEGSMRADVNVSVRKPGGEFGTRTETKNVNSVRFVMAVVEHEAKRQVELIEGGGTVAQETRLFDPDKGVTRSLRSKEDAHDYRYFPDPDLLPVVIGPDWIARVQGTMTELPAAKRHRFVAEFGLALEVATTLTASREMAEFYERLVARLGGLHKMAASWLTGEFSAALNRSGLEVNAAPVSSERLAALLERVADNTVSGRSAKEVFDAMWNGGMEPDAIIDARGLRQVSDAGELEKAVDQVLASNAKQVEDYRAGKDKAFNSLVGQVMKATQGKANPAQVGEILRKRLAR